MPASHEAIGREIQWTGDGRVIDFHVILPLTPEAGPAGLQPRYEQFACTGMPEAPGTPAA